jgi:uncharacterized protein GlcG (DUF336 family)
MRKVIEMYEKPHLSLDQVQATMSAMLEEARKDPRPIAIAVLDDQGLLLSYARMDNCALIPQKMAVKKAYASASTGADSLDFGQMLKSLGLTGAELGDPNLGAVEGGLAILRPGDGSILGGIGVSGYPTGAEDAAIAQIGLKALDL